MLCLKSFLETELFLITLNRPQEVNGVLRAFFVHPCSERMHFDDFTLANETSW